MLKRVIVSTLVGGVVITVQAGLFFGFLFAGFFAGQIPAEFAGISRPAPNFGVIVVADQLYAAMLVFLFVAVGRVNTFGRGLAAGMVIGFAVTLHFDLIYNATTYLTTPVGIATNVGLSTFMSGVGGGVIAATLGRLKGGARQAAP